MTMFDNDSYYHHLLNTARWKRLKRAKMGEAQGMCERCRAEGRATPATEVHHVTPVKYGLSHAEQERLCFDYANLQALCKECHKRVHKELKSHGREGNKRRNRSRLEEFRRKFLE